VTPTASRAQQPPQLAAQASMAMEMNMQALQVKHAAAILIFEVAFFIFEICFSREWPILHGLP